VVCKRPEHAAIQALLRESRPDVLLDDAGWLVLTGAPARSGVSR
jgi:hypothetical protein